jgi:hypothetical protein
MVGKIKQADTVTTQFDAAVREVSKRLEIAAVAVKMTADALAPAEKKYKELEAAANAAAKQVEKASSAGKDTKALASAAADAKAKMEAQGKVVDSLKQKSTAAEASHKKLGDQLGVLKGKQASAAAEIKKGAAAESSSASSASLLTGAIGGATLAAIALAVAVYGAVFALGAYAVSINPAATMRLQRATERLQIGFRNLFKGLNLDKFIGGLEDIMTLFDQGTSSANGMKAIIETVLQPLFDGAAKAAPLVKEMFKGMIYGAIMVIVYILQVRNAIFRAMSPETRKWILGVTNQIFTLNNAFLVGKYIVVAIAAAIGLLIATLIVMYAWVGLAIAAIVGIVKAIKNWDAVSKFFSDTWDSVKDTVVNVLKAIGAALLLPLAPLFGIAAAAAWVTKKLLAWADGALGIAQDFIAGLIMGLTGGIKKIEGVSTDLGNAMTKGVKAALDAHSPSRVMMKVGLDAGEGLALGMDASHGDVAASGAGMAGAGVGGAAGAASSGGTGSRTIHIENLSIGDSPVAKDTFAAFKQALLEALEGASLTIGGGEVPST